MSVATPTKRKQPIGRKQSDHGQDKNIRLIQKQRILTPMEIDTLTEPQHRKAVRKIGREIALKALHQK
jgi:hypothetical protein